RARRSVPCAQTRRPCSPRSPADGAPQTRPGGREPRAARKAGLRNLDDAVSVVYALALVDAGREREAVSVLLAALAPHLPRYQRSMANYARRLESSATDPRREARGEREEATPEPE